MADVRVLLVDDHSVFSELLRFALDAQKGIRCVGRARTARAAFELAESTDVDVAVVDVRLTDGDGIDLAMALRGRRRPIRCVALTGFPTADVVSRARTAGIRLLAKDGSLDALLTELRGNPAATTPVAARPPALTAREREVLELLSEGLDAGAISRALSISVHTTRGHVKALLAKTGSRSQLEAVAAARRAGLLDAVAAA